MHIVKNGTDLFLGIHKPWKKFEKSSLFERIQHSRHKIILMI